MDITTNKKSRVRYAAEMAVTRAVVVLAIGLLGAAVEWEARHEGRLFLWYNNSGAMAGIQSKEVRPDEFYAAWRECLSSEGISIINESWSDWGGIFGQDREVHAVCIGFPQRERR